MRIIGSEMMDAGVYIPMRGKPRTLERTILTDGRRERRMVGGEEGGWREIEAEGRVFEEFCSMA